MKAKSQLFTLKNPLKYGQLSSKLDLWSFYTKTFMGLVCWELGLAFCLTQFSTQVPSLTSKKCCHVRHPCHSWDSRLGSQCEVLSYAFDVTMVTFWMTLLMTKFTNIVMKWWMSPSINQNPKFFCQQLVMKYCHEWLKFEWKDHLISDCNCNNVIL
jgi:hypothetical protein